MSIILSGSITYLTVLEEHKKFFGSYVFKAIAQVKKLIFSYCIIPDGSRSLSTLTEDKINFNYLIREVLAFKYCKPSLDNDTKRAVSHFILFPSK